MHPLWVASMLMLDSVWTAELLLELEAVGILALVADWFELATGILFGFCLTEFIAESIALEVSDSVVKSVSLGGLSCAVSTGLTCVEV